MTDTTASTVEAATVATTRRLTGLTPSGGLQLGNYVGAIRPLVDAQYDSDSMIFIADLHAMTTEHDPAALSARTMEVAMLLLAAGVDPQRTTLYIQSHVPEHAELHYLLECVTNYGEAHRMIQFKEKSRKQENVRLSLLTYPVLMAADILLYDIAEVPVGEDQRQHVELARDVSTRFNHRYGATFVVPRTVNPQVAARLMDLSDPRTKMGKTNASDAGVLRLLDPPQVLRRKVRRAITDTLGEVRYDPAGQPGVANLLEILAACAGDAPAQLAPLFTSYGELKEAVADAVVATLRPLQERYADLAADPSIVRDALAEGAQRARERAQATLDRARLAMGLLAR
jgi:tryptophanyl-tRNA synthetase